MNREQWLGLLAKEFDSEFERHGYSLKPYRISCGLPSRGAFSNKRRCTGECWYDDSSADKTHEIFISPTIADSIEVGHVLVHELCHVAVGPKAGHKTPFKRCAIAMGLIGQMTATVASDELAERLHTFSKKHGPYPHAVLLNKSNGKKKQDNRQLKATCPNESCDYLIETNKPYTVRLSRTVFEAYPPFCGCCESHLILCEPKN